MVRLNASSVRTHLAETLNRVSFGGERVILHRHGKDLVAIVPLRDLDLILEAHSRQPLPKSSPKRNKELGPFGSKSLGAVGRISREDIYEGL